MCLTRWATVPLLLLLRVAHLVQVEVNLEVPGHPLELISQLVVVVLESLELVDLLADL